MSTPKTVMVVDDDEQLRKILGLMLRNRGYRVVTAGDSVQMSRLLAQELPDGIMLDAMLPGKDGFEICVELKSREVTKSIPVLMISGIAAGISCDDSHLKAQVRADDFVSKPFTLADLVLRVVRLVGPPVSAATG